MDETRPTADLERQTEAQARMLVASVLPDQKVWYLIGDLARLVATMDRLRAASRVLPDSIQQALNEGDGSYRP